MTISNNSNNKDAYIAALSADFMTAMLQNPSVDITCPSLADHAVAQVVALDAALSARFGQPCNF